MSSDARFRGLGVVVIIERMSYDFIRGEQAGATYAPSCDSTSNRWLKNGMPCTLRWLAQLSPYRRRPPRNRLSRRYHRAKWGFLPAYCG